MQNAVSNCYKVALIAKHWNALIYYFTRYALGVRKLVIFLKGFEYRLWLIASDETLLSSQNGM